MNHLKNIVAITLLLLTGFASAGYCQTRKGASASRRARRPAARVGLKTKAPCPSSLATTTASGLTFMVTRHGTGPQLKVGDTVQVHYTGLLSNGMTFDSSLERGEPIEFPLGASRVIKGWDEGILLLHVGDQATLIIPPQLGYGARGKGAIPPEATLIFIIEVVGVKDAASSGGGSMESHRR
jgi:FKBP-type peptidyl-prolyl cis-trans isomerase